MKYRIKSARTEIKKNVRAILRARRRGVTDISVFPPLPKSCPRAERINFEYLFAMGELPEVKKKSKKRKISAKAKKATGKIRGVFFGVGLFFKKLFSRLFSRSKTKRPRLAFFAGAMCASLTVTLFSAAIVLIGLFSGYLAPYEELTIPQLIGEDYSRVSEDELDYELLVSFEHSEDIPAGVVISQMPDAGVVRKIYKNGKPCTVAVTVSMGRHYYEITDMSGKDERLALLELRNGGVAVSIEYAYSGNVKSGTVISTTPKAGERLYDDEVLTLTVSLGKQIKNVTVPELYGLSEAQARSMLEARGLVLGKTVYKNSDAAQGKIIGQGHSAYSKIPEGSTVDITVSLGNAVTQKYVPDLFGLTKEQAIARLAQFGLVLGAVIPVSGAAPAGTIVAQTPVAGTPITSTVTSIDIYVTS